MGKYVLRRLLSLVPTLLGISLVVFVLVRLTGDPVNILLPIDATDEARQELREDLGLDRPLPVQYLTFLGNAVRGDFGNSVRYKQPALELFIERLPATIELSAAALLIAVGLGIPMGFYAAAKRDSAVDNLLRFLSLVGQAIPIFYLGLVLIVIFAVKLNALPATGRGGVSNVILPAVSLATPMLALIARLTRYCMLDVLSQDYVRTARAKGLREQAVLRRHVFKNGLIPIVTVIGLQVGTLFGGAVVTETVFAWPGVGRLAIQSIYARDFPVTQVSVLLLALIFVLINLLVDISYTWIDPRIRLR